MHTSVLAESRFFHPCFPNLLSTPLSAVSIHPACLPFLPFSPPAIYHPLCAGGPVNVCLYRRGKGVVSLCPHINIEKIAERVRGRVCHLSPLSLDQITVMCRLRLTAV